MITGVFPMFYSFVGMGIRMGKHYTVPRCKICSLPQGGDHTYFTYLSLLHGVFATTTDSAFAYKHKNLVYLKERELVNKLVLLFI